MFKAYIEANMLDEDTALFLSEDTSWLQAQWPECVRQTQAANKTVTGDPVLKGFNFLHVTEDGELYNFEFDVPVA
jgi:hypothetical protein